MAVGGAMAFATSSHAAGAFDPLGLLCAAVALLMIAYYGFHFALLTREYRGDTARVIAPIYTWGAVMFLPWVALDIWRGQWLTPASLVPLGIVGLMVYPLCYVLQHYLLARVGASTVRFVGLGVAPLVAIETPIFGMSDFPSLSQWISITLTITLMYLVIKSKSSRTLC